VSSCAQPLQFVCSALAARCSSSRVQANGFVPVYCNTLTGLVTVSDYAHCFRMSLGSSKLPPPQRFIPVL
jgi:hypothetical protein